MKIKLDSIKRQAEFRPAGYVDDVLSAADEVTATHCVLSREAYARLREKYATFRACVTPPDAIEPAPVTMAKVRKDRTKRLCSLWADLHRWAADPKWPTIAHEFFGDAKFAVDDWLKRWSARIPCGDCKTFYRDWIKANPWPDDPTLFFEHAWRLHNAVNAKLGKPIVDVEAARRMYAA